MFPKIDKKILIILIIVLIAFLVAGYFVFKYTKEIRTRTQDLSDGANTEEEQSEKTEPSLDEENSAVEIEYPRIEADPESGLFICVDQCGDKVCQTSDTECKDNINCICPETKEDCPSDCQ